MDLISWIATISTLGFFFANAFQTRVFIRNKSVGEQPFFPFAATYFNTILWLKYGIFLADPAMVVVNGVGSIFAFISMCIYYRYTVERAEMERKVLQLLGLIFGLFLIARIGWLPPRSIGFIAMVASVVMFGSPLIDLRTIIKTRDSSTLSPFLILMTLLVSISWFIFGVMRRDYFVIVPNALGGILGLVQLFIYFKYHVNGGGGSSGHSILGKEHSSYERLGTALPN